MGLTHFTVNIHREREGERERESKGFKDAKLAGTFYESLDRKLLAAHSNILSPPTPIPALTRLHHRMWTLWFFEQLGNVSEPLIPDCVW